METQHIEGTRSEIVNEISSRLGERIIDFIVAFEEDNKEMEPYIIRPTILLSLMKAIGTVCAIDNIDLPLLIETITPIHEYSVTVLKEINH